jgi:hypothetical protein
MERRRDGHITAPVHLPEKQNVVVFPFSVWKNHGTLCLNPLQSVRVRMPSHSRINLVLGRDSPDSVMNSCSTISSGVYVDLYGQYPDGGYSKYGLTSWSNVRFASTMNTYACQSSGSNCYAIVFHGSLECGYPVRWKMEKDTRIALFRQSSSSFWRKTDEEMIYYCDQMKLCYRGPRGPDYTMF